MKHFLNILLFLSLIACRESKYVEYKPHYLSDNNEHKYYGEPELDSIEFENTQFVLNYYGEDFTTKNGNKIFITKELAKDWELVWNYTTKANDKKWLNKVFMQRSDSLDSVWLSQALVSAKEIAAKNLDKDSFQETIDIVPHDSFYPIQTEIQVGNLFDNDKKYCLIKRANPGGVLLDIYAYKSENGENFKELYSQEEPYFSFVRDTIFDANGDGLQDYLAHWYPSSGCCRRNVYRVFLQDKVGNFTEPIEFMNPTFYPKEKIIRGVKYGHPGEVPLYKYKWNGSSVDTIEFIHPLPDKIGDSIIGYNFLRVNQVRYYPQKDDGKFLSEIPKEYLTIEDIDWFKYFE